MITGVSKQAFIKEIEKMLNLTRQYEGLQLRYGYITYNIDEIEFHEVKESDELICDEERVQLNWNGKQSDEFCVYVNISGDSGSGIVKDIIQSLQML